MRNSDEEWDATSLRRIFPEFNVPVSEVEEVFPAVVMVQAHVDLYERPPLRTFGLADQAHARLERRAVGFLRVTLDARANDVLPCGGAAAIARDDVIKVEVLAIKNIAAVLAHIAIALEDIMAREFHFLLRHAVEQHEQNDTRNADAERDGVDALGMRFLLREIVPLAEIEGLKGSIGAVEDDLGAALEQERESPLCRADVHRLPKAVEH